MRFSKKKLIFIILIVLIGIIVLSTVIYQQTALWKPEQSLITLLPESPICYLTLKELEGLVNTFNRSEFGKQTTQMPILSHIKRQLWWRQLVYQKLVWEYEMGGKLDMRAVKGHFGNEAILAIYQREGELSFLLITEVGGPEKLAIEAITATDAINPRYKRIQTEYNGLTINTITGYPLDFSYTFIGKIGVLSLNPLLLAEVIDIYAGKKDTFLVRHSLKEKIQVSYDNDTNTGYLDVIRLLSVLKGLEENSLVELLSTWSGKAEYCTLGNRYADGVIISRYRYGNPKKPIPSQPTVQHKSTFLPKQTAFVTFDPNHDWTKTWKMLEENLAIEVDSATLNLSQHLDPEITVALVTHNEQEEEVSKFPSLILHTPIQDQAAFSTDIERLKNTKILVSGKPLEFLEIQEYKGITVQPVQLRLNFLLAFIGGYAIVDNHFFFSTTLAGLKSVLDANSDDTSTLSDVTFSNNGIQTHIQPNLLVPEIKRLIPIATLLASLSGQKLDAVFMQHIKDNLFPLESLGPITADFNFGEDGMDAEVRIVLEK